MDESDGVFAKRRRNVIIVGIVILIIFIGNPDLSNIKIFDLNFSFKDRIWTIWLGLTIWFIYVLIRAWSYYNTFLNKKETKRKFDLIFEEVLQNRFNTQIRKEREKFQRPDIIEKFNIAPDFTITGHLYPNKHEDILLFLLKQNPPFIYEDIYIYRGYKNGGPVQFTYKHKFELGMTEEEAQLIKNNRKSYYWTEYWWEHTFIFLFSFLVIGFLLWYWVHKLMIFIFSYFN